MRSGSWIYHSGYDLINVKRIGKSGKATTEQDEITMEDFTHDFNK